jgi:hypothetical protein
MTYRVCIFWYFIPFVFDFFPNLGMRHTLSACPLLRCPATPASHMSGQPLGSSQAACWDPGTVVHTVTVLHTSTAASPMSCQPKGTSKAACWDPGTVVHTVTFVHTVTVIHTVSVINTDTPTSPMPGQPEGLKRGCLLGPR